VKSVQQNLENLEGKLGQTDAALKNPDVKPDWLDITQKPQLFSKEWKGYQEAGKRGFPDAESGYRWEYRDGQLSYERTDRNLPKTYYNEGDQVFKNADIDIAPAKFNGDAEKFAWSQGNQPKSAQMATERMQVINRRNHLEDIEKRAPEGMTTSQKAEGSIPSPLKWNQTISLAASSKTNTFDNQKMHRFWFKVIALE
jgi:hypothetical protein